MIIKRIHYRRGFNGALFLLMALLAAAGASCSQKGLVRDQLAKDFYQIPKKLDDENPEKNPRFIIYGDNRPGWRANQKFAKRSAWLTWKHLYLPGIYQLYWLGNGVIGGFNYLRYSPDYGDDEARRVRDAVYAEAKRSNVDFIINTGDIVTDGRRPKLWKRFLEQYKYELPVVTEYPYLPVIGNHELANDSIYGMANFRDVFSYPPFYAVTYRDVDFFILNSNVILDQEDFIDNDTQDRLFEKWFVSSSENTDLSWLEHNLAESKKTFKIVVMHHPVVAFAKHNDNWSDKRYGNNLLDKRRKLLQLFAEYKVDILFTGHQHMYEHDVLGIPVPGREPHRIHVVITGGAGAPLHRGYSRREIDILKSDFDHDGIVARCAKQEVIYNYCFVDVSENKIIVKVMEVSDKPEKSGRVVDTLVFEKTGTNNK